MKKYSLIIHGGCGAIDRFSDAECKAYLDSLGRIISDGEKLLAKGWKALDVVEACVKMLEDDPLFNAGKGSVLNEDGKIEMDASIMDGRNLRAGSVAGIRCARNPVGMARLVMEKTPHVMVAGEGVERLMETHGIKKEPPSYFITSRRQGQLKDAKRMAIVNLDHGTGRPKGAKTRSDKLGTVGAVAYDQDGDLAAATSTGGMTNKMAGRIGDSPLIGCGTYADNETCAVSCTGRGEDFIRTSLAKHLSDLIRWKGWGAEKAAQEAIRYFGEKVTGYGGFIMIDHRGGVAHATTTPGLIRASVQQGKKPVCKIFD